MRHQDCLGAFGQLGSVELRDSSFRFQLNFLLDIKIDRVCPEDVGVNSG